MVNAFNKKGEFGFKLFSFFFVLMIVSGVFFFMSVNLHYIFYDFAIDPVLNMTTDGTLGISSNAQTAINTASSAFLGQTEYMDYFFGVMLLSLFVSGIISSIQARQYGLVSFFGMITLGNLFLVLLISFALQIRGWFLNNIAYAMLTTSINMPILTFFFNYSYEIAIFMFLTFLAVNQLDLNILRDKFSGLFGKEKGEDGEEFSLSGGKFEQ